MLNYSYKTQGYIFSVQYETCAITHLNLRDVSTVSQVFLIAVRYFASVVYMLPSCVCLAISSLSIHMSHAA